MRYPRYHVPPVPGVFRRYTLLLVGLLSAASLLAYTENFDDNLAQSWTVGTGDGTWPTPSGGVYNQTGNILEAIATYSGATWNTAYTYSAKVRTNWTGTGNRVGLVYNYASATDYAYVEINTSGLVQLGKVDSTHAYPGTLLESGSYTGGGGGVGVTLEVVRHGSLTSIRVNGADVPGLVNLSHAVSAGRIGLLAHWNETASFDDVQVTTNAAEVDFTGNGVSIADGDTTPGLSDHTDFGSAAVTGGTVSRTFTIHQSGTGSLTLSGTPLVAISGTNAADFTVTDLPDTVVPEGGSTTFTVRFDPSAAGVRSAAISVLNNDPNEGTYNFNIQGTGDNAAPTVSVTAPADGSSVSGPISVMASASDDVGVVGVQFKLNGANLGAEDTGSPFGTTWDTTTAANGTHVLTAVARDAANNTTTSAGVFANVNNGGALPTGWTGGDIGAVGAAGSATFTSGVYTIAGAGSGIFNTSDEFRFAYLTTTGDCTIVAHVASEQDVVGPTFEHAGVMIRQSLDADSAYAGVYQTPSTPGNGVKFESRLTAGGSAIHSGSATGNLSWLKLSRLGNVFTAWRSDDGTTWTLVGSTPPTITMTGTVYVGLAVSSESDAATCLATFDNVSINGIGEGDGVTDNTRPFPRLGAFPITPGNYQDTSFQAWAKKHDLVILGVYKGWNTSHGALSTTVSGIHTGGPKALPTRVFNYTNSMAVSNSASHQEIRDKLDAENWWLYAQYGVSTTPQIVGSGNLGVNDTAFPDNPPDYLLDANGKRASEWITEYYYQQYQNPGTGVGGVANLDGFFEDNVSAFFAHPWTPQDVDFNRDGVIDPDEDKHTPQLPTTPAGQEGRRQAWREGRALVYSTLQSIWPTGIKLANVAIWQEVPPMSTYPMSEYDNTWQGGVIEGLWDKKSFAGWTGVKDRYVKVMARLANPKFGIFHHNDHGADPYSLAGMQDLRYALTTCLVLENGYFWSHKGGTLGYSTDPDNLLWYDEYDNAGADASYLGQPLANSLGAKQTSPRWARGTDGIWAREFDGGIAISNPENNGSQTLTVGATGDLSATAWKRIDGTQWSGNDGSDVTSSITLQAGDGIILLRK